MAVDFKDNSEAFSRALHEVLDETVPMSDLFTVAFLTEYTQFASCDEMFQYLLTMNNVERPKSLTREHMDAMTIDRTSFSNWHEMLGTAHKERIKSHVRSRLNQQ